MIVREIFSKAILSKSQIQDYALNPYVGCSHSCRYCYAAFMRWMPITPKDGSILHADSHQAVELVEILLELIKSKLAAGEDVLISGFGKFCVKKKRERRERNPATGEETMLAPRPVVTFKCSGQLRDKINNMRP